MRLYRKLQFMNHSKNDFLEILSQYQGILHKVNLIYFNNKTEQEDNLQEIIYNLWKSFPELKNRENPASWIYAVSINTSISRLRKKTRVEYRDKLPDPVSENDSLTKIIEAETSERLLEAVRRLNEIDRMIMLLYLEDRSYDEIALITGLSRSNVGVRINRAKELLKKQLNLSENGK